MSVRVTYEHELEVLKQDLKEMAHMVESAIEQTFMAFEDQDYTMAEDVIKGDRTVNDMERAIESRCLSLILRQQPVASDLRQVSTALKVVTDLERIGDHASDIAELILNKTLIFYFLGFLYQFDCHIQWFFKWGSGIMPRSTYPFFFPVVQITALLGEIEL